MCSPFTEFNNSVRVNSFPVFDAHRGIASEFVGLTANFVSDGCYLSWLGVDVWDSLRSKGSGKTIRLNAGEATGVLISNGNSVRLTKVWQSLKGILPNKTSRISILIGGIGVDALKPPYPEV
ncbi:MAG: hypothetical protein ACE5H0_13875, partial [Bacteroidota bacterium]